MEAQKCQGGPLLAMQDPTVEATLLSVVALVWLLRPGTCWAHFTSSTCLPDTSEHLRLRERGGGERTCPPPPPPRLLCMSPFWPSLLPILISHSSCLQGFLPRVCVTHLPLSLLLISLARRSGGRGEERRREGQVRMREQRKGTTEQRSKRDGWSFLLRVSFSSLPATLTSRLFSLAACV